MLDKIPLDLDHRIVASLVTTELVNTASRDPGQLADQIAPIGGW
jgi:hypothetical protein